MDVDFGPLKPCLGRFCETSALADVGTVRCYLFDWRNLDEDEWSSFLDDTFCDGFTDGYLGDNEDGGSKWVHPTRIPFALADWDGDSDDPLSGQFNALWLLDTDDAGSVLVIDIDGTASPDREPVRLPVTIAELAFRPISLG